MREWVLRRNKVLDDKLMFSELMLFLLDERKIIKYVEDDIRKPNPVPKVKACNLTHEIPCEPSPSNINCLDMFKQFQETQELQNKQFRECITNLTQAFNNAAKFNP